MACAICLAKIGLAQGEVIILQTLEKHGHAGWQPQDSEIEHGIKNALGRHPHIQIKDLKIFVKDRDVTLRGMAANQHDFDHAAAIAAHVFGVREFKNELTLSPGRGSTPTQ